MLLVYLATWAQAAGPSPSPPPPLPPPQCANVQLTKGWQMISFNCVSGLSNTFEVLETASWKADDKIITRDPFLKFVTFDGQKFVGGLMNHDQLLPSLGYRVYYTGEPANLTQTGLPQLPVENVVLRPGWNWIGHAPLHTYPIEEIASVVGSPPFGIDDQVKTRASSSLMYSTFDGQDWAGNVAQLMPGIGYEFKVAQSSATETGIRRLALPSATETGVTFCYGDLCGTTEKVELTLEASGSVSDYSGSDVSRLQQHIATAAGVDQSLVTIAFTAGSVIITATIAVPASMTADEVQTSLSSALGTADAASKVLNITVVTVLPGWQTSSPTFSESTATPAAEHVDSNVTLIGGAAAAVALLAFLLFSSR